MEKPTAVRRGYQRLATRLGNRHGKQKINPSCSAELGWVGWGQQTLVARYRQAEAYRPVLNGDRQECLSLASKRKRCHTGLPVGGQAGMPVLPERSCEGKEEHRPYRPVLDGDRQECLSLPGDGGGAQAEKKSTGLPACTRWGQAGMPVAT